MAEGPWLGEVRDWGRAFAMPTTGSVLVAGHNPLGAFFRAAQVEASAGGAAATPLVCEDEADEMVEVDEAWDDSDEDELERCALFRGMYILKSSLAAPLGWLLHLWNTGWATAVITVKVRRSLPEQNDAGAGEDVPSPFLHASPWLLCGGCSHGRSVGRGPQHDARRQSSSGGGGEGDSGAVQCSACWLRHAWAVRGPRGQGRVVCVAGACRVLFEGGARATLQSSSLSGRWRDRDRREPGVGGRRWQRLAVCCPRDAR